MAKKASPHLPLRAAYPFGEGHGLTRRLDAIRKMAIKPTRSSTSSVRRGYVIELFKQEKIFDRFVAKRWPFGNTPSGHSKSQWYLGLKREWERR